MVEPKDQYSASVSIALRVKSPIYIRNLRAIFNVLGLAQVHGIREALDIGVRGVIKRHAREEDLAILKQHLEAMDKS